MFEKLDKTGEITKEGIGLLNDPNLLAYVYFYCLDAFWVDTEFDEGLRWNTKAFKETYSDNYSTWLNIIEKFLTKYGIDQKPTIIFVIDQE